MKNMNLKICSGILLSFLFLGLCSCTQSKSLVVQPSDYDLDFQRLAATWDEGIPLGNGVVGALVWQKDSCLRFSLDRLDLWDLRANDSLKGPNFSYDWVRRQVAKGDYKPVQNKLDRPYDEFPAPSKIPGAGLNFSSSAWGKPSDVHLFLNNAVCYVSWQNGVRLQTFVHADKPVGWFRFENVGKSFVPRIDPPVYEKKSESGENNPVDGQDLCRLGYKQGTIVQKGKNCYVYHQQGWGNFYYEVAVKWHHEGNNVVGAWSVSSSNDKKKALAYVDEALKMGIQRDYQSHLAFWNKFWDQSSVSLPDSVLARQYANEMYKLGCTSRPYSYPISLQSVWTADNGKLPPWKGDFHHDLNTQLSYWPCFTGNHLDEALSYLNTLWNQRKVNEAYTKQYFGVDGLDVPGVETLTGQPMGGWAQYSLSPTVSAWLSQYFYLYYQYTKDDQFLKDRAYPYIKEVATFLKNMTYLDKEGVRRLPMSSSPEINDNSIQAWFKTMTNYDLALCKSVFKNAAELATDLHLTQDAEGWQKIGSQFGQFDLDKNGALTFAKDFPFNQSHRHFSNSLAIHPLGLIDWNKGAEDQKIIKATIANIDRHGPDYWCGYTYSWFGNLKARAYDGEGAAKALKTFAECFCLKNTFHANGDQSNTGKSKFTYRPFTLEGNFAFAAGIQEMLLQSHSGIVHIFPAIPASWKNVAFKRLRTYGAFLVSSTMKEGTVRSIVVKSEKGGTVKILNPFKTRRYQLTAKHSNSMGQDSIIVLSTKPGDMFYIYNK